MAELGNASRSDGDASVGDENCQFCKLIFNNIRKNTGFDDGEHIEGNRSRLVIGKWDAIMLQSHCLKHVPFVRWGLKTVEDVQPSSVLYLSWDRVSRVNRFLIDGLRSSEIGFIWYDSAHPERSQARLIDASWVDSDRIRMWKDKCNSWHGGGCQRPMWTQPSQARPARLVDVWNKCLVEPPEDVPYVALSYVWGSTPFYMTLREDLPRIRQPNSLASNNSELRMPISPVILDAMGAVQLLGERYLWADALCIVQDDEVTKRAELDKMGEIYSRATVTIVAALGSGAESGLPGLKGFSTPRNTIQDVYSLSEGILAVGLLPEQRLGVWDRRAWTFQEMIFSRRCLIFGEQTVEWRCASETWYEYRCESFAESQDHVSHIQYVLAQFLPRPGVVVQLINGYNERLLTYDGDALDAFAGIASTLSRSLKGGLICGLPEVFFYIALLWQPETFMEFRHGRSEPDACLPSWSWASFRGRLRGWAWHIADQFARRHNGNSSVNTCQTDEVYPVVQWSCHQTLNSPGEQVRQTWLRYRGHSKASEAEKAGWTRHLTADDKDPSLFEAVSPDQADIPGSLPEYFYTHDLAPESRYWWPIPLPEKDGPLQPQRNVPFISGRTRRAWLQGAGVVKKIQTAKSEIVQLRAASGAWAGAVEVTAIGEMGKPASTADNVVESNCVKDVPEEVLESESRSFELVEVARGTVGHALSIWEDRNFWDSPFEQEIPGSEVHYVMWIKWEGKVAYRRGLGRVLTFVWETLDLEWIDLILG